MSIKGEATEDPVVARPAMRADLAAMSGYHSPQVAVDIRLNTNESPMGPPEEFVEDVISEARRVLWHRYPDRAATALRQALGESLGQPADRVYCANGSNEVLQNLLLTYAGAGRTTLTFEPTYALHSHLSRTTGSAVASRSRGAGFALDRNMAVEAVLEVRPAVTFLCSPNNPTGLLEPKETVEAVLGAVETVGGLLVVDEAYGEFAPWSAMEVVDSGRSLAVVKTYSKTWAMAGVRLGYMVAPDWLVESMLAVTLPYHLDSMKQAMGIAALKHHEAMKHRVQSIISERTRIEAELERIGCEVWPSAANFILFRPPVVDTSSAASTVWQRLVERSVLIRDTSSWKGLEGCLRVTIGSQTENSVFLDALADILDSR